MACGKNLYFRARILTEERQLDFGYATLLGATTGDNSIWSKCGDNVIFANMYSTHDCKYLGLAGKERIKTLKSVCSYGTR